MPSYCQILFSLVRDQPIFDHALFPSIEALEQFTLAIRQELLTYSKIGIDSLPFMNGHLTWALSTDEIRRGRVNEAKWEQTAMASRAELSCV